MRGDSGYGNGNGNGNEGILLELEQRAQRYLPRLRQTASANRLMAMAMAFGRTDRSRPDAQDGQMIEGQARLHGWSRMRRAVTCASACARASRAVAHRAEGRSC